MAQFECELKRYSSGFRNLDSVVSVSVKWMSYGVDAPFLAQIPITYVIQFSCTKERLKPTKFRKMKRICAAPTPGKKLKSLHTAIMWKIHLGIVYTCWYVLSYNMLTSCFHDYRSPVPLAWPVLFPKYFEKDFIFSPVYSLPSTHSSSLYCWHSFFWTQLVLKWLYGGIRNYVENWRRALNGFTILKLTKTRIRLW